jgi:hypothetical protein
MIPVTMGDQEIVGISLLFDQTVAQAADACAGVDNKDIITAGADFKTGGIATIL